MSSFWILDIWPLIAIKAHPVAIRLVVTLVIIVAVVAANKKDRCSESTGNIEILLEIQSDTTNSVHSYLYMVFSSRRQTVISSFSLQLVFFGEFFFMRIM